ncbi:hypothetical protein BsWGS_17296 [Bradybaena similaris]
MERAVKQCYTCTRTFHPWRGLSGCARHTGTSHPWRGLSGCARLVLELPIHGEACRAVLDWYWNFPSMERLVGLCYTCTRTSRLWRGLSGSARRTGTSHPWKGLSGCSQHMVQVTIMCHVYIKGQL